MAIAPIVPGKTRIGWIGTGVMGRSMCGHLIERGYAGFAELAADKGPKRRTTFHGRQEGVER